MVRQRTREVSRSSFGQRLKQGRCLPFQATPSLYTQPLSKCRRFSCNRDRVCTTRRRRSKFSLRIAFAAKDSKARALTLEFAVRGAEAGWQGQPRLGWPDVVFLAVSDTGDADATDGMDGGCADDGATVRGLSADHTRGRTDNQRSPLGFIFKIQGAQRVKKLTASGSLAASDITCVPNATPPNA